MEYQGNIFKMRTEVAEPVRYYLPIGGSEADMNALLGHAMRLRFDGQINCICCGKRTKTSFGQGFCFSCFKTSPEASETVVNPELSRAHFGIARDLEWSVKNELVDHFVYLAVSKEVKVGVTRGQQIPTRWIDQGASSAIRLAKTPNRHIAGVIEFFLKKHMTDKTSWKEMLQNQVNANCDLIAEKEKAIRLLPAELRQYACDDHQIVKLSYPVLQYPEKVTGLNFDKDPVIEGHLVGIKGQYLIFDHNRAVNIRRHSGYYLTMTVDS
ncbi:MAG: DUF2797 domain-containing protein [Prolixibacteraceae bacterium]